MQRKIKSNKKRHCVQTHNPCRGSRLRAKIRKWRVALLQVVTRGLNISSPKLTLLAYFGECFREGNIRYNETFTDQPSFQPPLSFSSTEQILTETFLQVVQLGPCQSNMARYEKKNTSHSLRVFGFFCISRSGVFVQELKEICACE